MADLVLIDSYEATGSVSSIEFTAIPDTFTDLAIYLSGRADATYGQVYYETYLIVNSVSGSGKDLYGNGSAAASTSSGEIRIWGVPSSAATLDTFGNALIYIPNYASSTAYKSISIDSVSENNATASMTALAASIYSSNTPITSLGLNPYLTGNFVQYSSAYLYGIK